MARAAVTSDFVMCSNSPHPPELVEDHSSDEEVEAPKKTRNVAPVYPGSARAKGVQGVVVIEAIISSTGCISSAKVIRSVSASLDLAAMNAVSGWRYTIPVRGETPVDVLMTVSVNFTLR
jgi:TonB family protein